MRLHYWWLAPALLLAGCKDSPEQIPAYLHIEPFTVDAKGGAGWQEITEGWLYVNNEFIGGYSLPATVPVLAEGDAQILVFPGVKENGQKQTPAVYPFLTKYSAQTTLSPAVTTTIHPATKYDPLAIFPWSIERATFDNSGIVFENRDADTANTFIITSDGAFDGRSVLMAVDTAHSQMEIASETVSDLPVSEGQPVWLEINYQNDVPFEMWVLGSNGTSNELSAPVYQFSTSANWNKTYFNLTQYLITLNQQKYRLFFRVTLPIDASGKYTQNTGTVRFDNLRLVHF